VNAVLVKKRILVGVTGGIAAYKAAELVSLLCASGATVTVVLTEAACQFIRPLTFKALSGNEVYTGLFEGHDPLPHITAAKENDLLVVYPATANFIGHTAAGLATDLLTTTVLGFKGPVVISPSMNSRMFDNAAVQQNLARLQEYGYVIIPPESGRLACGEVGQGRLPSPGAVLEVIRGALVPKDLKGLKFLVTAGPTREPLDPVRYVSNRSSGKMGYALARAARDRGAQVVLINGPTSLDKPPGVSCVGVRTALEMRDAALEYFEAADVVIMCAAVSDYRAKFPSPNKVKKGSEEIVLEFIKNPDILEELGRLKRHQLLVGFAAEDDNILEHARRKLEAKNLDMVVANLIAQEGAGFEADTNIVKVLFRDGRFLELPRMDKYEVAQRLMDMVLDMRRV
jgi:phosphopantothenoylcysteine decarboxylase/phosphopantothenate--cysteine ligase